MKKTGASLPTAHWRELLKHPLSLFPSSGHSLTQFVRHCADHFLNSEHKEIRMEAARTCSRLLTPSIHLISGHMVSQTAVQVVADVLSKLLVVGITDPGDITRLPLSGWKAVKPRIVMCYSKPKSDPSGTAFVCRSGHSLLRPGLPR